MAGSTGPVRTTATRARQGRWGRHMVWVLTASLFLGVLGVFGLWAWRSGQFTSEQVNQAPTAQDVSAMNAPAPPTAAQRPPAAATRRP